MNDEIKDLREKIDEIDNSLFELISFRAYLTNEIGKIKKKNNIEIEEKNRELIILKKLKRKCKENNIDENLFVEIYKIILTKSKEDQT